MKTSAALALALAAVLTAGTCGLAEEKAAAQGTKPQTTCPVMKGGKINKSLYVDCEGKRIYVCCKGCIPELRRNAAKYVKELEAEGITLDAAPAEEKKAEGTK